MILITKRRAHSLPEIDVTFKYFGGYHVYSVRELIVVKQFWHFEFEQNLIGWYKLYGAN
jgi:hypothetical protein